MSYKNILIALATVSLLAACNTNPVYVAETTSGKATLIKRMFNPTLDDQWISYGISYGA